MTASPERALQAAIGLHAKGREAEAEQAYRRLVEAHPHYVPGHRKLIALLRTSRRWGEALAAANAAVQANPTDAALGYTLATSLFELGRWDEGFRLYEARRALAPQAFVAPPPGTPEWQGEPLGSLLILPEQGFGDAIQFARYAQVLQAAGAAATLVCRPELQRLFATLDVPLAPIEALPRLPRHDFWAYQASLPRWLRGAPPASFRLPLGRGAGVGVCARGNPAHANDRRRSLQGPDAERLLALGRPLDPEDTGARDFLDTAEIVADLDLVISVDTSVAHLAASLGKPCWILLADLDVDWRWMRERADSPWYPSARLYRQPSRGDWASVLDAVERDLAAQRLGPPS